jgi:hypothetical protein
VVIEEGGSLIQFIIDEFIDSVKQTFYRRLFRRAGFKGQNIIIVYQLRHIVRTKITIDVKYWIIYGLVLFF